MYFRYDQIYAQLCAREDLLKGLELESIVGIARGGIFPATVLSQRLGLPLGFINKQRGGLASWTYGEAPYGQKVLLVDDLAASGETLTNVKTMLETDYHCEIVTFVLYYDEARCANPPDRGTPVSEHVYFPWDNRDETPGTLIMVRHERTGFIPGQEHDHVAVDFQLLHNAPEALWKLLQQKPYLPTLLTIFGDIDHYPEMLAFAEHLKTSCCPLKVAPPLQWQQQGATEIQAVVKQEGINRLYLSSAALALEMSALCPQLDVFWMNDTRQFRISGTAEMLPRL